MSLEQLTRKAIHTRHLDAATARQIRRCIDRGSHLTPEQYEALRNLGRALRSGEVTRVASEGGVQE